MKNNALFITMSLNECQIVVSAGLSIHGEKRLQTNSHIISMRTAIINIIFDLMLYDPKIMWFTSHEAHVELSSLLITKILLKDLICDPKRAWIGIKQPRLKS